MEASYQLIFSGEISPVTTLEAVKQRLQAHYNLSPPVIRRLFSGGEVVIKNNIDYQTASKLMRAFEKAGAICRIRSNRPPRNITDLPATPHVARKVMQAVADPNASARSLQQVIAADQQLTAKILRIANSSFYGGFRSISNLSEAIVRLGFKNIKNIAVSSAVRSLCGGGGFTETLLWEHSIGCAIASQLVARSVRFPQLEEAFLVGLMHDIGKVVFQIQEPEEMKEVIQEVYNDPQYPAIEVERQRFQADHAEIGRQVARKWHFPEAIEEAIAFHHEPQRAEPPSLVHIVHFADGICHKLEIGPIRHPQLDLLGLPSAPHLDMDEATVEKLVDDISNTYETEKGAFMN